MAASLRPVISQEPEELTEEVLTDVLLECSRPRNWKPARYLISPQTSLILIVECASSTFLTSTLLWLTLS